MVCAARLWTHGWLELAVVTACRILYYTMHTIYASFVQRSNVIFLELGKVPSRQLMYAAVLGVYMYVLSMCCMSFGSCAVPKEVPSSAKRKFTHCGNKSKLSPHIAATPLVQRRLKCHPQNVFAWFARNGFLLKIFGLSYYKYMYYLSVVALSV